MCTIKLIGYAQNTLMELEADFAVTVLGAQWC